MSEKLRLRFSMLLVLKCSDFYTAVIYHCK